MASSVRQAIAHKQAISEFFPGESEPRLRYGMTNVVLKEDTEAGWIWIPWGVGLAVQKPRILATSVAAVLVALLGCASHDLASTPVRPGSGVEEFRQLTSQASVDVLEALRWLEQVSAQPDQCPPKLVTGFAQEVEDLQIQSIKVRAKARAILARGDAYFEAWSEGRAIPIQTQALPPPDRIPKIHQRFEQIKEASKQVGEAFRPFFAGLRKLRAGLQTDPAVINTSETRELVRATREEGLQVLQRLGALRDELSALRGLLTSAKPAEHI